MPTPPVTRLTALQTGPGHCFNCDTRQAHISVGELRDSDPRCRHCREIDALRADLVAARTQAQALEAERDEYRAEFEAQFTLTAQMLIARDAEKARADAAEQAQADLEAAHQYLDSKLSGLGAGYKLERRVREEVERLEARIATALNAAEDNATLCAKLERAEVARDSWEAESIRCDEALTHATTKHAEAEGRIVALERELATAERELAYARAVNAEAGETLHDD